MKSYKIPTYASVVSVVANALLNAWFIFGLHWGPASIALATSASAAINWALLARALQVPSFQWEHLRRLIWASAVPAGLSLWAQAALLPIDARSILEQAGVLGISALIYGGGVLALARVFKIEELMKTKIKS